MSAGTYERPIVGRLRETLLRPPHLIEIVLGPRQVGKSWAARQLISAWNGKAVMESADAPIPPGPEWIRSQWERAASPRSEGSLLVLDEIQKVRGWSETVKSLWDRHRGEQHPMRVVLLGSSTLLISKGMSESLAGRFRLHRMSHWTFAEARDAFGLSLDRWLYFGGYPGAYALSDRETEWAAYIRDSFIESVLAKDVLQLQTVAKPALLRHLFMHAASAPAQIISWTKLLGQLLDAGNTTTLAHYARLLQDAFLLSGLEKWRGGVVRKRGSSPKLVLWSNALVSAVAGYPSREAAEDHAWWGRLVENAVGAHFLNTLQGQPWELNYWREGDLEVDYVLRTPRKLWAIEVKSSRPRVARGLAAFCDKWPEARPFIVGAGGMPLEEFFLSDPTMLFS